MRNQKYLIEQRDESGALVFDKHEEVTDHREIMHSEGVTVDKLLMHANNYSKAWVKSEFSSSEVGSIGPSKIDAWLKDKGLSWRPITWR
jgi:hypothetical protein